MMLWLILAAGGILTYFTRIFFIALLGKVQTPPLVQRALRFVPPAVLTAIIFQELLTSDGRLALDWSNPRPLAGLVAALVAWRTRSPLWTILAGALILALILLLNSANLLF
jgi:branched-subunit amino acid transport protein